MIKTEAEYRKFLDEAFNAVGKKLIDKDDFLDIVQSNLEQKDMVIKSLEHTIKGFQNQIETILRKINDAEKTK